MSNEIIGSNYSVKNKVDIKIAAYHIQEALSVMVEVQSKPQTPMEIQKRLKKIIDAFSLDKDELDRIIKLYYENSARSSEDRVTDS